MKGNWHFVAFAITTAFLTHIYGNYMPLIAFTLWICFLIYTRRLRKLPVIFSLTCLSIFLLWQPAKIITPPEPPQNHNETFTGTVTGHLKTTQTKAEFVFREEHSEQKFSIIYFFKEDQPSNILKQEPLLHIKHGATCLVTGHLEHPQKSRNPGQFDYQKYLQTEGITYQLILKSPQDINCQGGSLLHYVYKLRMIFQNLIFKKLSSNTAAWLNALVLGDKSELSDEVIELFQRWGMSHILAISGLHIGLIVGLLYFLLVKLNIVTKEKAHTIIIIFLPFYALIAGGQPSVLRASLMVLLILLMNKFKFKFSATDILSVVFVILILFDPYIIYHIGFQMSFIVTFGLILSREWIAQTNSSFFKILRISFVAQMIILPIQFIYFYTLHPLSIIINTLVVPYFSVIVIPLMFLFLIFSFLPAFLIGIVDALFNYLHELIISMIQFVDHVAYHPFIFGEFPLIYIIAYYIIFFIFMRHAQAKKLKSAFSYGCLLTLLIITIAMKPYFSSIGTITMLDIGQGDAFVIELPYRKGVFMIDAGSRVLFDDTEISDREYNQVIKPYLDYRGIQKIDSIFLSHEHIDHIGSVPFLLADKNVSEVIISNYYDLDNAIGNLIAESKVKVTRVSFDEEIVRRGQRFHVLSPTKNIDANENSLVLYTVFGDKSWLFTGDIYKNVERDILKHYGNFQVDVLKVAHHGSDTSTDEKFLQNTKPNYALISVGNNSYGHPNESVIQRLIDAKILTMRTDENGAIQYRFKGNNGTFFKHLP